MSVYLVNLHDRHTSTCMTDLIWVGDVGAAVTCVSHPVSIPVQLVSVLDTLAIIQEVLQTCTSIR